MSGHHSANLLPLSHHTHPSKPVHHRFSHQIPISCRKVARVILRLQKHDFCTSPKDVPPGGENRKTGGFGHAPVVTKKCFVWAKTQKGGNSRTFFGGLKHHTHHFVCNCAKKCLKAQVRSRPSRNTSENAFDMLLAVFLTHLCLLCPLTMVKMHLLFICKCIYKKK